MRCSPPLSQSILLSNSWGIPTEEERAIRVRDKLCVYCSRRMKAHPHTRGTPADKATIEHLGGPPIYPIYYDEPGFDRESIAICCGSCNSSHGGLPITDWFSIKYCMELGIDAHTVAPVVKVFIRTRRYDEYRRRWWARWPRRYRESWQARHPKPVGPGG